MISILQKLIGKNIWEFSLSVAIRSLANAIILIFLPAYIYQQTNSVMQVLLFYLTQCAAMIFFSYVSGKLMSKYGPAKLIMFSAIPGIIFYLALYFNLINVLGVGILALFLAAFDSFFWTSFGVELSKVSNKKSMSKDISTVWAIISITGLFGPIIGAFIINYFGFPVVFIVAFLLLILAPMPLLFSKEYFHHKEDYYFKPTPLEKKLILPFLGQGVILFTTIFWSMMMFILYPDFTQIGYQGFIVGILGIISVKLASFFYSKWKNLVMYISVAMYSIIVMISGFSNNIKFLMLIWMVGSLIQPFPTLPFDAMIFSASKKLDKIKFFVNREICFNFWRVVFLLISIIFFVLFDLKIAFLLSLVVNGLLTLCLYFIFRKDLLKLIN